MTTLPPQRSTHPYHMYDAIYGQPDAISRVMTEENVVVDDAANLINNARQVHVVGVGTSWHAALVGEYVLRTVSAVSNCRAWNSFEFVTTPPPLDPSDVVLILSHRGTKSYSVEALKLAKQRGCSTILITAIGSKARRDLADLVIQSCPEEISSAFTVSHVVALAILMMISVQVATSKMTGSTRRLTDELTALPELVTSALDLDSNIAQLAQSVSGSTRHYFTGWGPNESTAYEVALKIKETSYVTTEGFQLEQYLHGPFVATEKDTTVTFICPPGHGRDRTIDLIKSVKTVNGYTVGLVPSGDEELVSLLDCVLGLPECPDFLTPVVYLIPLQLYTYWLALEKGCNPDVFRLNDPSHLAAKSHYIL